MHTPNRMLLCGALALSACVTGLEGLDLQPVDTDEAVRLVAVSPSQGPLAGGTQVSLSVEGLTSPFEVSFGGRAVLADLLDPTTLLLTTPAALSEAAVDVTVRTAVGESTLPGAFLYLGTTGTAPDTGQPVLPNDNPLVPSQGVSGVIELSHLQLACPACLPGRSSALEVAVNAVLHEPAAISWSDWLPPLGSCALNAAPTARTVTNRDVGGLFSLTSGSESIQLLRTTLDGYGLGYSSPALTTDDMLRNAAWVVDIPGPGDLGTVALSTPVLSGRGFDSITPAGLLINAPSSDLFSQPVSQAGQTFAWAPVGPDSFVIQISAYDATSGLPAGSVTCHGPDNGSMTVPATYLGSFPSYASLLVTMSRYRFSEAVVPGEGSVVQGIGWFGVEGTAYLQP